MYKYACGCIRDNGEKEIRQGKDKCYSCMKALFGKRVSFIRYGDIPESGRSINWAENRYEAGVSCYLVEGGKIMHTVRGEFCDRNVICGTAIAVGTGSDDELLIDASTIELVD